MTDSLSDEHLLHLETVLDDLPDPGSEIARELYNEVWRLKEENRLLNEQKDDVLLTYVNSDHDTINGCSLVADGHARIDGKVVRLVQPNDGHKKTVLFRKLRDWWPEKVDMNSKRGTPLYVAEAPDA